jgi:hypothetical protein
VLVTSLFRRTQPIIRMDVSDMLTVTDAPCSCGRTLKRISVHGGRSDDILELPGARGGYVPVHPIHLRSPLTKIAAVSQYQIVLEADGLNVRLVVAAEAAADAVAREVASGLAGVLRSQGAAALPVRARVVERIERETGAGRFKLNQVERARPGRSRTRGTRRSTRDLMPPGGRYVVAPATSAHRARSPRTRRGRSRGRGRFSEPIANLCDNVLRIGRRQMTTLTIRLDPKLEKALERIAKSTGRTKSEIAREAIERQVAVARFRELR